MDNLKCVYTRVTFYVLSSDGDKHVYDDYDILVPSFIDLFSALSFSEFTAKELLSKVDPDFDLNRICDVVVSFRKSHQLAGDPSVLP